MGFDPSKPFEKLDDDGGFDPSKPFETVEDPGQIESFSRAVGNNVPLVPQAIAALSKGDYSENLKDWKGKASEAKSAHPITYGAGATVGALAPLLIPGIGEGSVGSVMAKNAALGAADAISNTDLIENPVDAVKEGVTGALIGGGTAGILNKVLPGGKGLEKLANSEAIKAVDVGSKTLERLTPEEHQELGKFIRELGLIDTNKNVALEKAIAAKKTIGDRIKSIGSSTEESGLRLTPDEHYDAVKSLLAKSSEHEGVVNREGRRLAKGYENGATDILNLKDPTWNNIQQLKEQYGSYAFGQNGEVKDEAAKDVYFKLRDMLKSLTEKAQDNPNLPQEYKDALLGYHRIDPVVRGLTKQVGAERAGGMGHEGGHGLTKIIRSLPGQDKPSINIPTAIAAGALLHPAAMTAVALPTFMNPAVRSKVAAGLSRQMPKVNQGINQAVIDYLTSLYGGKR